jgi:RNA polymerase primary sigma factor
MVQQSVVDKLASKLMCTPARAREFANEVNWLLLQSGHLTIPVEQIYLAASALDLCTVTPEDVVSYVAGLPEPEPDITVLATSVSTPEAEKTGEQAQTTSKHELADRVQCVVVAEVSMPPCAAVLAPNEQTVLSPAEFDGKQSVLAGITAARPECVTYDQIEKAMADAGLDPYIYEDAYTWIMERLEDQGIPVVDAITNGAEHDLAAMSRADRAQVDKSLAQVFGNHKDADAEFLTAEEQRRLMEVIREGKRAAQQCTEGILDEDIESDLQAIVNAGKLALGELLLRNRRLVASVALKYGRHAQHLTLEDLIQEGMIGLMHGIERFDLDVGHRLSTYVTWWIRQAISRAVSDQDRTIRLPVHRVEAVSRYVRAVHYLERDLERKPTEEEIAVSLNLLSPRVIADVNASRADGTEVKLEIRQQLNHAMELVHALQRHSELHPISLDKPMGDAEESCLGDFVPDSHVQSPETVAFQHALCDEVYSLLDDLSDRERRVIIHRFGLRNEDLQTLEAIGRDLYVTRERVRQIEAKALRKLRHPLRSRKLRDFIDYTPFQTPPKEGETTDQGEGDEHCSDPMPEPQSRAEVAA